MTDVQTGVDDVALTEGRIRVQINRVVASRAAAATARMALKAKQAEFEQNHAALIEANRTTVETLIQEEAALRELVVQMFRATNNKTPAPGCGIRETTTFVYDDVEALQWCQEHNLAITFDRTAFEALVKAGAVPQTLVKTTKTPSATIATKLEAVSDVA